MSGYSDFSEDWIKVDTEGKSMSSAELQYLELQVRTPNGPLRIAVDPEQRRHLLLEVASDAEIIGDRRSRGIQIVGRDLVDGGGSHRFVDVVCVIPDLDTLFDDVIRDMIDAIRTDHSNPAGSCREVLGTWRRFIEGTSEYPLSLEKICGLYGELIYLERFRSMGVLDALDLWKGWDGSRHDFGRNGHALEVKSSLKRDGRTCQINGALQLLPPADGSLLLGYLKLEAADDGRSVPELVDGLISGGVERFDLFDRLKAVGYLPIHEDHYRTVRFVTLEDLLYEVSEGFPRIIPDSFAAGSLPAGVSGLVYSVDLLSQPPFPIPMPDVQMRLKAFTERSRA
jgi:hypothetical protein